GDAAGIALGGFFFGGSCFTGRWRWRTGRAVLIAWSTDYGGTGNGLGLFGLFFGQELFDIFLGFAFRRLDDLLAADDAVGVRGIVLRRIRLAAITIRFGVIGCGGSAGGYGRFRLDGRLGYRNRGGYRGCIRSSVGRIGCGRVRRCAWGGRFT